MTIQGVATGAFLLLACTLTVSTPDYGADSECLLAFCEKPNPFDVSLHPTCPKSADVACSATIASLPDLSDTPNGIRGKILIDFIFLLEFSLCDINRTQMEYVASGVRTLVNTSRGTSYRDFNMQYAVVAYSLHRTVPQIMYFQGFSSLQSEMFGLYNYEILASLYCEGNDVTRSSRTLAIYNNLQMITTVINREEIVFLNGSTARLHPRPHADLHVVSVFDPHDNFGLAADTSQGISDIERSIQEQIVFLVDTLDQNKKAALHFFVDPNSKVASSLVGDPLYSITYSDCTHFNKALTLKALIAAGEVQASSLQAHLLSKGIGVEVNTLGDWGRSDCLLAINPALWSGFSLHAAFSDKCNVYPSRSCPEKYYCSPLHGCIKRQAPNGSRKENTFEGRAPLTAEFTLSHADLANPTQNIELDMNTTTLPTENLSITARPAMDMTISFSLSDVVTGSPTVLQWDPKKLLAEKLITRKEPMVLKNTVIQTWSALKKWNFSYLAENMGYDQLNAVKCSDTFLTFDPDKRAPLKLNLSLPFVEASMATEVFFNCIQYPDSCPDGYKGHYYFSTVPDSLRHDVMPDRPLFNTDKDYEAKKQFMWISSAGMITHGHFDQDFNVFVQLVGEKRFTLWSPSQHELMYVYPRIHPMWHKSRLNFQAPDIVRFPQFAKSRALQVTLEPGDVLFVPPYTWHYVETLSPSVSLSTWSHDYVLYDHMNSIYRHDHKFDLLEDPRGQMFVLRLYLDMMIHDLYGFNETTNFFARLLAIRFAGLEHLFPPSESDPELCNGKFKGKIPTCVHVHGYAKLDMEVVGSHFEAFEPEVRDILFQDYVEEITAQVVGVKKMLAFFRYCFLGQEYYITDINDEEHSLWDHKDPENTI